MSRMFVSISEAALMLGLPVRQVYALGERSVLQEFRDRHRIMYKLEAVNDLIRDQPSGVKLVESELATLEQIYVSTSALPYWVADVLDHGDWTLHQADNLSALRRNLLELWVIVEPGLEKSEWVLPALAVDFTARVLSSSSELYRLIRLGEISRDHDEFDSVLNSPVPSIEELVRGHVAIGELLQAASNLSHRLRASSSPKG